MDGNNAENSSSSSGKKRLQYNFDFKLRAIEESAQTSVTGNLPVTRGGNLKPPQMDVYLRWIVEAWASISSDLIRKSFVACGINAVDGSEDDDIHVFKPDGPCPQGREVLKAKKRDAAEIGFEEQPEDYYDSEQDSLRESDYENSEEEEYNDTELS